MRNLFNKLYDEIGICIQYIAYVFKNYIGLHLAFTIEDMLNYCLYQSNVPVVAVCRMV